MNIIFCNFDIWRFIALELILVDQNFSFKKYILMYLDIIVLKIIIIFLIIKIMH